MNAPLDDAALLRRYADAHDESAFAELVARHVNLVHSAALRQVNGDAHLAADVTQLVFTDLARKAGAVAGQSVLAGWLFTSTRFAAANIVRGERRRQIREREAQLMHAIDDQSDTALEWQRVRPVLDEAIAGLGETDRAAILLRFFEGRDFADIGARLSLSANAARMRVERALERLHAELARRGVTSTAVALGTVLAHQAVALAPSGLAASVTGAALAGSGATGAAAAITTFMSMTKLQLGLAGAIAVAGGAGFVWQAKANAELETEIAALRAANREIAGVRAENHRLARAAMDVAALRTDEGALDRLQADAATLQTRQRAVAQAEASSAAVYTLNQLDRQPRAVSQARPEYPAALRSSGVTGEAVVEFIVDVGGNVRSARAVRAGVYGEKTEAADPTNLGPPASRDFVKLSDFTVEATPSPDLTVRGVPVDVATRLLADAAVEAVSKWRFESGNKGGRPVNTRMQVPIVFKMAIKADAATAAATKPSP